MGNKPSTRKSAQKKQNPAEQKTQATGAQVAAAQEAKREARMQRQVEAKAAAERRRRKASIRKYGIILVIALVVAGGVSAAIISEANKPGQSVAQQPSPHLQNATDPHTYNTDPPTSGPHLGGTAPWGVSTTVITKELQVHNLEDGGVIINYRPDLDKATVDRLAELTRNYDTEVILAPYPGLSNPIVLTTWGRMDRLDAFDDARIRRFVNEYRGKDHHRESGS